MIWVEGAEGGIACRFGQSDQGSRGPGMRLAQQPNGHGMGSGSSTSLHCKYRPPLCDKTS
jgi:hypothetical protein